MKKRLLFILLLPVIFLTTSTNTHAVCDTKAYGESDFLLNSAISCDTSPNYYCDGIDPTSAIEKTPKEECRWIIDSGYASPRIPDVINLDEIITLQELPKDITSIGGILGKITPILFTFAGIVLFIFLIYAGFNYLTSQGDPKKVEGAKGRITAALIGFIIVFVAYWIVQIMAFVFNLKDVQQFFSGTP